MLTLHACVLWGTLAARHLMASFLSAVLSLVPVAALWLVWQSAGCLQAIFPCLSPPETYNTRQQTRHTPLVRKSLRCKHRNIRSEVYEGTVWLLRLIIASVSRVICDGSKRVCYKQCRMACLYSCTMHGIPAVKLKSKWQHTVQISLNNAMMHS